MFYGLLERLTTPVAIDPEEPLRDEAVYGYFAHDPRLGKHFVLVGAPVTPGTEGRMVKTSPVQEIQTFGGSETEFGIKFRTLNTWYLLTPAPAPGTVPS